MCLVLSREGQSDFKFFYGTNIHIIMIYLISNADCFCLELGVIYKDAVYCVHKENFTHVFFANNHFPLYVNFYEVVSNFVNGKNGHPNCQFSSKDFCVFEHNQNFYLFLNFKKVCNSAFHSFKFKGKEINLSLSQNLVVSVGSEVVLNAPNNNLEFSHFEEFGGFGILYFLGERNFVVVLKGGELFFSGFCDEVNRAEKEIYFLTHLHDILNHGKVCHLGEEKPENYLVYLDENSLNLKPEFLPATFLDCVMAQNFKYANALLSENLKQQNANDVGAFFAEFDGYFCLSSTEIITTKKRAIVSAFKFEIENNKIANIIEI